MKPAHHTRPGSSLLLAILIVAITLGTATTLATISIQALKRTSTSGDAAGLLYAAESGLERQLYLARKQKNVPIPSVTEADCGLPNWPGAASGCVWKSTAATVQQYTNNSATNPPAPKRDQAVQVYVAVGGSNVQLKTTCTDDTAGAAGAWVEITRLQVSSDAGGTWQINPDETTVYKQYYQCVGTSVSTAALTSLDSDHHYVVRVRALYDHTTQLALRTYVGNSSVTGLIRGTQTLKVTAQGSLAQQVVKATFPAAPAAVGFVDYVLFSECSIKKGVGGAASCP